LGIAVDFRALVAFQLNFARTLYPPGHVGGAFRFCPVCQVTVFDGRYLDVDIDTV